MTRQNTCWIHAALTSIEASFKESLIAMFARFAPSVVPNVKFETLQNQILNNVKYGSIVYTDAAVSYNAGMQRSLRA
jgi:hypothetical protein